MSFTHTRPEPNTLPPNTQIVHKVNKIKCDYCGVWNNNKVSCCEKCGAPFSFDEEHFIEEQKTGVRGNWGWNCLVNIRTGPDIKYPKIGILYPDTPYSILERNGDWIRIGKNQWVNSVYLSMRE